MEVNIETTVSVDEVLNKVQRRYLIQYIEYNHTLSDDEIYNLMGINDIDEIAKFELFKEYVNNLTYNQLSIALQEASKFNKY